MSKYTIEILEPLIKESFNYKELINKLGLTYCNGSRSLIFKLVKKYNINTDHFYLKRSNLKFRSNEELFVNNSDADNSTVKLRILKYNLIEYKCQLCGNKGVWLDQKMPLILDHINGINNDHRLENLRFLCSNCDSIQPTYKSKNKNLNKEKIFKRKEIKQKIKNTNNKFKILEKNNLLKEKILNSNIDFTKRGWRLELGKLMNWTPQYAGTYINKYIPEFNRYKRDVG